MKKFRRVSFAIIFVFILSMFVPTLPFSFNNVATVNATTVKINKTKLTLNLGKTYNLKVTGTTNTVKWSSSNKSVATVSSIGKVTAKKKGTATITATVNSKKYSCKVTVTTKYKDGEYEGSGTGYRNGTTTVSITIKNDVIKSIKVLSNEDTSRYFNYACDDVISEIMDAQSTDVDAVSGATYSSMGIIEAVQDAMSNAKN